MVTLSSSSTWRGTLRFTPAVAVAAADMTSSRDRMTGLYRIPWMDYSLTTNSLSSSYI
jgi:hypothetical protein